MQSFSQFQTLRLADELWKYQLPSGQKPETCLPQPKKLPSRAGKWQCMCRQGPRLASYGLISIRCPSLMEGSSSWGRGGMDTLQPRLHPREWTGEQLCQGLLSSLFMPEREWGIENLQDLLLPAIHSHCAPIKARVAFSTFYLQSQVLETFSKTYRVKQCHELGCNQEQIWFILTYSCFSFGETIWFLPHLSKAAVSKG